MPLLEATPLNRCAFVLFGEGAQVHVDVGRAQRTRQVLETADIADGEKSQDLLATDRLHQLDQKVRYSPRGSQPNCFVIRKVCNRGGEPIYYGGPHELYFTAGKP